MPKVTIYTTPTCVYCKATKEFLASNNIAYKEIDVAADTKAAEIMVQKSGQLGVPVIIIESKGKESVVVGFDQPKLSELLAIN